MAHVAPDLPTTEEHAWFVRYARAIVRQWRPCLGWAALAACLLVTTLPASAIGAHDWVQVRRIQTGLTLTGPLAVTTVWLVMGWRHPRRRGPSTAPKWRRRIGRLLRGAGLVLLYMVVGTVVLSQLFLRWLPTMPELWRATLSGQWTELATQSGSDFLRFFTRYALWWQGIQAGGAAQDDLVFAGLAGSVLWASGLLTGWLARSGRSGFVVALPSLWLSGLLLIYTPGGRGVMAIGLALTLTLQLLLDQHRLVERWSRRGYDFSGGLIGERYLTAAGIVLMVLTLAVIVPSVSIDPIARRYYEWLEPFEDRMDQVSDRLFPDMRGAGGRFGRGIGGGLPNEFLLRAGSDLGQDEVMRVRTSDAVIDGPPGESPPPPGHYMRNATFAGYDGLGWGNPVLQVRDPFPANERWTSVEWQGRKPLVQSIVLSFYSNVLFAAPEPVEPATDYHARVRADGDVVALTARTRSYNIVSSIPAVSDETLAAAPGWDGSRPLPDVYAIHLDLPDTVTERTRQLAYELTDGLDSPFAKAQAIETYLRTYEYDLTVPEPPPDVLDVADFFLFDLERGYCDYYATAFVVLARLAGLPARFATGYAVGTWNGYDNVWIVTEAEAHSWPEVLFPDYGWIPFEPTAGRPELTRIGLPQASTASTSADETPTVEPIEPPGIEWNWQMLIWLLPLGLLAWGTVKVVGGWRARRQDPWIALLGWGHRAGRPIEDGETALEYGDGLAGYVVARQTSEPDTGRYVAREVQGLSGDVTDARYAPLEQRQPAIDRAADRWQRLRVYLRRIRLRKDGE